MFKSSTLNSQRNRRPARRPTNTLLWTLISFHASCFGLHKSRPCIHFAFVHVRPSKEHLSVTCERQQLGNKEYSTVTDSLQTVQRHHRQEKWGTQTCMNANVEQSVLHAVRYSLVRYNSAYNLEQNETQSGAVWYDFTSSVSTAVLAVDIYTGRNRGYQTSRFQPKITPKKRKQPTAECPVRLYWRQSPRDLSKQDILDIIWPRF